MMTIKPPTDRGLRRRRFRWHKNGAREAIGSLLLGLLDDVGSSTTSASRHRFTWDKRGGTGTRCWSHARETPSRGIRGAKGREWAARGGGRPKGRMPGARQAANRGKDFPGNSSARRGRRRSPTPHPGDRCPARDEVRARRDDTRPARLTLRPARESPLRDREDLRRLRLRRYAGRVRAASASPAEDRVRTRNDAAKNAAKQAKRDTLTSTLTAASPNRISGGRSAAEGRT